ncbi:hypothetical protein HYPSUDRAFT_1010005 [Hypholoma sublateritium FD-334 SS-4]|uniref:Malate dehydrogenase n=1 Tax=Hypholoma sublateritium (strain FD-334 SS-4) TaxID=945553 RepID=A0A0D2KSD7_HYPSF|nr:hypothetical protein HYPSUDRAFT_1010005 [Hypholoma sublateritium FD-334 SS-4]
MISSTTAFLIGLVAPLLASGFVLPRSVCDASSLTIPNLEGLPAPAGRVSFVGIAVGTQNYTCDNTGVYTNVGALAELFDISCLTNSFIFPALPDIAFAAWEAAPPSAPAQEVISFLHQFSSPAILGQHYYVTNPITGSGIDPKWDFTTQGATAGNKNAFVVAAKNTTINAPTDNQDIQWVFLTALTGKLAAEVYRTDTRGGQPPATCTPGSNPIVVKYAAKYWGFGGSL